jgi:DNA end-binding protein Ku
MGLSLGNRAAGESLAAHYSLVANESAGPSPRKSRRRRRPARRKMLLPIEGKKPKEGAAKKTASKPQRRSA